MSTRPQPGAGTMPGTRSTMDRLWTPWRMEYVASAGEPAADCLFCDKARQTTDEANLLLYRGNLAYILLNLFPYNTGHLMVAPYQHTADLAGLDPAIGNEIFSLAQRSVRVLELEY